MTRPRWHLVNMDICHDTQNGRRTRCSSNCGRCSWSRVQVRKVGDVRVGGAGGSRRKGSGVVGRGRSRSGGRGRCLSTALEATHNSANALIYCPSSAQVCRPTLVHRFVVRLHCDYMVLPPPAKSTGWPDVQSKRLACHQHNETP